MARGELPSLPQEIMVEILSRLPSKSVAQFRCVSKPWRVLLSDPQFINTHLNNRRTEENLIVIFRDHSIHCITDVGDDNVSRTIRFQPELPGTLTKVVGSCNGLVLLLNEEKDMFLVNPTTLRQVQIPDSPGFKHGSISVHGLGYDAATDDYKIVALSSRDMDDDHKRDMVGKPFVFMYSMKRGIWKRLERFSYHLSIPYGTGGLRPGVFVNGSIHWLARTRDAQGSSVIVAFDLADEKFKEIPGPEYLDVNPIRFYELTVLKGCLCMVGKKNIANGDIWLMEECGIKKSWVKLNVTWDSNWQMVKPLCFIGDDKIVLEINLNGLIVYRFKTGTLRDFMVDGMRAIWFGGGVTFVDSLISPSHVDLM